MLAIVSEVLGIHQRKNYPALRIIPPGGLTDPTNKHKNKVLMYFIVLSASLYSNDNIDIPAAIKCLPHKLMTPEMEVSSPIKQQIGVHFE